MSTPLESAEMVVSETIDREDFKRFERIYIDQVKRGQPSAKASFDYAVALVKGSNAEVKLGIRIFEDLCQKDEEDIEKRTYLYYLAIGNTRIREYDQALMYTDVLLNYEPENQQVRGLKELIEKKKTQAGLIGAAAIGGGALIIGGIAAGLFAALRSR